MTKETPNLKTGLTFGTTTDPYRAKNKTAAEGETASLEGGLTFGTSIHPYDGGKSFKKRIDTDLYGEGLLGESLAPKAGGELKKRFLIPPFSVMNARDGAWQDRKRAWLALGIQSELGRGGEGDPNAAAPGGGAMPAMNYSNRERGTGSGAAIPGTVPRAAVTLEMPEETRRELSKLAIGGPAAPKQARAPISPRGGGLRMPEIIVGDAPVSAVPVIERPAPSIRASSSAAKPFAAPTMSWRAPSELPQLRYKGIKQLSIDVETRDPDLQDLGPGARRPDCYIVGFSIAVPEGPKLYIPVRHEGGGNMDPANVFNWARNELNWFDGQLVGANLLYDLDFLANEGVTFPRVKEFHDVQIIEPLLDEWRLQYGLDALAKDYLNESKVNTVLNEAAAAYGWKTEETIKKNLWRLPAGYVGAYGEGDADLPLRIFAKQAPKIAAEGLEDVYRIERKLIPMLLAMRRRGVRIDIEQAQKSRDLIAKERDRWLAELKRLAGPQAEFMAPESFVSALAMAGITVPQTARGNPSVTSALLKAHNTVPIVQAIQVGRKLNTLLNTFFDGHILSNTIKGRIHCEFPQLKGEADEGGKKQRGTIARFSSQHPNLQNIPAREDEEITTITGINLPEVTRACFVPEEGEDWEELDESQIEYRLLVNDAVGKGSDEARAMYNNDPKTDFHKLAAGLCGIDPEDKKRRRHVKGLNFAKTYGAQQKRLAGLLQCSVKEAEEFIALYNKSMPFALTTFNHYQRMAETQGYITTILDRRQRFSLWEPAQKNWDHPMPALPFEMAKARYGNIVRSKTYTALNRRLQGGGADVIKKSMVDAWESGAFRSLGGTPLLTVHDSLSISKPQTREGEEAVKQVQHCMENCFNLRVPLLCDRKSGINWGRVL